MTLPDNLAKLATRARLATLALWATMITTAGMLLLEIAEAAGMISQLTLSPGLAGIYGMVAIGYTVAFIASVVLVAMWIHCAHRNLHELGIDGLEFTPGWAVGWYFIPFANLIKPFQAMRELRNASLGEGDNFNADAPGELKLWWGCWLGGNIISNINTRLASSATDASTLQMAAMIGVVADVLIIASAWTLIRLIRQITTGQVSGKGSAEVFA